MSVTPEHYLERQRAWLLEHFRANVDLVGDTLEPAKPLNRFCRPTCRCWSCGKVISGRGLFPDQVDPRYGSRRSNLRPACRDHVTTGNA